MNTTRYPIAYIRKSKRNDDSSAAQLVAVREIAQRDGIDPDSLVVLDDNGRSGDVRKLAARRGYLRLVEAVERGEVSTLYVRVLDRLGRDTGEGLRLYELLDRAGTRLVDQQGEASGEQGEDRVMMELWGAKKELRRAKERSAFTKRQRASRGDVTHDGRPMLGGNSAAYGWTRVREGERIVEVPNPDEPMEPIVEALRQTRGNVLAAARVLDATGSTFRGHRWSARTLGRIADRENLRRWRIVHGRRRAPSAAPLSRLIECHCGTLMTPTRDRRTGEWSEMYCANGHRQGAAAHGRYTARSRHVLDALKAEIGDRRRDGTSVTETSTIADDRARLDGLREELRRLGKAFRAGAVEDDEFDAESARVHDEIRRWEEWVAVADEARVDIIEVTIPTDGGPLVDWNAEPETIGDQLRRVVKAVRLGPDMKPVAVEMRSR